MADNIVDIAEKHEEEEKKLGGRKALIQKFGVTDVELSAPFEWCGDTYETVHLNFAAMTGADMEAIDDEMAAMGITVESAARSRRYQRIFAAKAGSVPSDMIEKLPVADYNAITNAARLFLLVTG
jgi:hypothetical protein